MNILILGSGGREHAFAWKLSQSPKCDKLFIGPGNTGTELIGINVGLDPTAFPEIGDFVITNNVDLVVVGPEVPLAMGIRNYFEQRDDLCDIPFVGPDREAALLESSKDFAKQFMVKYGIPTAGYATFDQTQIDQGLRHLSNQNTPIVLKADGLAAGKGVVICETIEEAKKVLKEMLVESKFGPASDKVVIEEFMRGIEISVFIVTDGHSYKILPSAKDYKRIGENDTGPNTGGMGAVSPVPFADGDFMKKVEDQIIKPTIDGLKSEGLDYRGFIFLGLINVDGDPKVIEYNVRMGDPETQVVLPRVTSDMVELLLACAQGTLDEVEVTIDPRSASTVVMVSRGYPGNYHKGAAIKGLNKPISNLVFHAGTDMVEGSIVTNGGRVLAVTALGEDSEAALTSAYKTVQDITWDNAYFRKDIGQDLLGWANKALETSTD